MVFAGTRDKQKIITVLYLLAMVTIVCRTAFAQKTAEELLSDYFVKYDDFYQEFALAYQGESWCVRPNSVEDEKLTITEGFVIESVPKKMNYTYHQFMNATGEQSASVSEELFVNGKLYIKAYSNSSANSRNGASEWTEIENAPNTVPRLQPHGLAIMRYSETVGKKSDLARYIPQFLRNLRFLEEKPLSGGHVRGTWCTGDPNYQVTVDFSNDNDGRPTQTIWGYAGVKTKGVSHCKTITKWKKYGDELFAPEIIEYSDVLGTNKTEAKFKFQYLPKELLEKKFPKINNDFAKIPGNGWHKEIRKWFEDE